MIDFALVSGHRFTDTNKALQYQVTAAESDDGSASETGFADAFGAWCVFAVPLRPELDAFGNVKAACEAAVIDGADERTVIGTRDVRVSKYAQDLKPGETVFLNAYGSRLKLGAKQVGLNAGGGFLSFDIEAKKVGLCGIPASPGAAAPYLAIDTESIGLVSKTGAASVAVKGNSATISGASISLSAGRVDLGKGASEPMVTYSMVMQLLAQLAARGIVVTPPAPGRRVFVPMGG
ncbi:MAG: hypothetical protein HYV09_35870 [Deltaproteobacteria bacterium]|nr:hypothetical protein [Deltaproteobacteria bacterium]